MILNDYFLAVILIRTNKFFILNLNEIQDMFALLIEHVKEKYSLVQIKSTQHFLWFFFVWFVSSIKRKNEQNRHRRHSNNFFLSFYETDDNTFSLFPLNFYIFFFFNHVSRGNADFSLILTSFDVLLSIFLSLCCWSMASSKIWQIQIFIKFSSFS